MDKQATAAAILNAALPDIAFDGWRMPVIEQAALRAGFTKADLVRVFPNGIADALRAFSRAADAKMEAEYAALPTPLKLHERIALLVRLRIQAYAPHKEAVKRAMSLSALPFYAPLALASLYETMDAVWQTAGDVSTDFNWYTKRLTLAGVYSSTLLYWINDTSEENSESWEFLNRRLGDVLRFGRFKQQCAQWLGLAPKPTQKR